MRCERIAQTARSVVLRVEAHGMFDARRVAVRRYGEHMRMLHRALLGLLHSPVEAHWHVIVFMAPAGIMDVHRLFIVFNKHEQEEEEI